MRLNELRDTSYEIAKSKGWHDPDFDTATFADRMALVISELAEALEEHRKGCEPTRIYFVRREGEAVGSRENPLDYAADGNKPEGVIIELADAAIRIGDTAGKHEIDLEAAKHFGLGAKIDVNVTDFFKGHENDATSFGGWMCRATWELATAAGEKPGTQHLSAETHLLRGLRTICRMSHWLGITGEEFESAIEIKHAYNRTRPFRHGGKKL